MACWRLAVTTVTTAGLDSLCGWGGLGVIIKSNLNRVRLSCCWVGVGLGCATYRISTFCHVLVWSKSLCAVGGGGGGGGV